jgi:hypothetical protein
MVLNNLYIAKALFVHFLMKNQQAVLSMLLYLDS